MLSSIVAGVLVGLALRSVREVRADESVADAELLNRARGGDHRAFADLVRRYEHRAYGLALQRVRDSAEAHDIVQEAFVRVHKNLASFDGEAAFFTWFYRIIMNLCIDYSRRASARMSPAGDMHDEDEQTDRPSSYPLMGDVHGKPHEEFERRELGARIAKEVEALPEYHRETLWLREVDGLSYVEIAQTMNVSKGTVMSRLFHARQKIQKAMADCMPGGFVPSEE